MSKSKRRSRPFVRRTRLESLEPRIVLDSQIGTVAMPYDGLLSAAVYDSNGQMVRTLLSLSHQDGGDNVPLIWDGKDNVGRTVLNDGTYTWKALVSQVSFTDEGGVGDSVFTTSYFPNPGTSGINFPDASSNPEGLAVDSSGKLYVSSTFVENANGLHQYSQDGQLLNRLGGNGDAVATDNTYLYLANRVGNFDVINKLDIASQTGVNFTIGGSIVVNIDAYDPRPAGQPNFNKEQERLLHSVKSLAVDSTYLYAINYRNNRVEVYNKVSGSHVDTLSSADDAGFALPAGVALQTGNTIWVTHNGSKLTQYTYTPGSGTWTKGTEITGLNDPTGVAFGGPNSHLFVAVNGDGQIREYSTSGGAPVWTFGTKHVNGPILGAQDFLFTYYTSMAIDSSGILNVNDRNRVQRFYTVTGGGHTAGDLKQSIFSVFGDVGFDTYGYQSDGRYFAVAGFDHYEVDPQYTGGPRAGWLGDGTWRRVRSDSLPTELEPGGFVAHRILMDGATPREFYYMVLGDKQSMEVFEVLPSGALRRSAIVGSWWYGANMAGTAVKGQYNWTDTDGDGQIDWNGVGSGVDGEVVWFNALGQPSNVGVPWVDDAGNIWAPGPGGVVKIPLQGFDVQHNPLYNFANMVTVAPFVDDDYDFFPGQVRVAANGDIYATGGTNYSAYVGSVYIPGYDWIARFDSNGNRTLLMPTADSRIPVILGDEADPVGDYFYTGHSENDEHWAYMYSTDGLAVTRVSPGPAAGGWTGWLDYAWGMSAFTNPLTGKTYISIEDVSNGKSERYRVDNLSSIQRQQGNFEWVVAPQITGRWKFDDNIFDTIGQGTGTFLGGSPNYGAGQYGKAIDLDGVDDQVSIVTDNSSHSKYAISVWVKPTDTTGVTLVARTSGGLINNFNDQLRLNGSGQFEHVTYAFTNNVGQIKTVTGTTVAKAGQWYHVVGIAENNGMMRLYVNGQEEGTAISIGTLWTGAGVVYMGPAAVGATGYFDGLVDELRIYKDTLTASDVRAIYTENTSERDGYWAFDNNLNDSAGGNNGTFNGGSPSYVTGMFGNGLNFDGVDDYVNLPYATDPENYTISAWVKPTDTSSVSIITRTSANGPATDFFDQLRINSSGQFEHYTNDGTGHTVTGTTIAQPGLWYHVTGTATSGGVMRLYVNGLEEGQAQNIGTLNTAGDRFYVGSNSGGGMGYFSGTIDEVRVYNEVISSMDIEDLFKNGDVPDMTGQWAFDNNVNASIGANHGTFNGGTAVYATGKYGNAIDLDGSDDYVEIPYANDPNAYTISAWIKPTLRLDPNDEEGEETVIPMSVFLRTNASGPTVNVSDQLRIISPIDPHSGNEIPGQAVFQHLTRSAGDVKVTGTTVIQSNTWYHVAIVAGNNGMMRLYLNGREEGTARAIGSLVTDGDRFNVGRAAMGGFDYFDGMVDDLRIYERVLTAQEIDSVYQGKANADVASVLPTINIALTDNKASETGSDPGTFTITRDGKIGNLVVNYTVGGSATSGSDYSAISGSVTILSGQTSATVTVTPIDDPVLTNDSSESVSLTLSASANYTIGAPSSAVLVIADNEATGDVAWLGSNQTANGNNFGWSYNTSEAGGTTGEIGGTVARSTTDAYYGDATVVPQTLFQPLSASGKFDILNITSGWAFSGVAGFFVGHFSTNPTSREFIGLEFQNNDTSTMLVRARVQRPNGGGDDTPWVTVSINGNHTFNYTYDPTLGDVGDPTPDGRLTVTIDSTTSSVNIGGTTRTSGALFDAFGLGYTNNLNTNPDPAKTAQIFVDDLIYSGLQTAPLPLVSIGTTDPLATEYGPSTGTFAITRPDTSGNLVVNYIVSGTATQGTDYSALSGSVTILNGQSTAIVTITPSDDNLAEDGESVVLTLSASVNYNLDVSRSAAVSIVDNEQTVTVNATDSNAAELGGNTGTFTITRSGTIGNLTVNLIASGTATGGVDYSALTGSIMIPNGQSSVTVTVTPIDDSLLEGTERVVLEIAANSIYKVGTSNRATVLLADNDAPGNPSWTGSNNTSNGNNYGWSETSNFAGGVRGEVGGTLTRAQVDSYFGDTSLSSTQILSNIITASGKFDLRDIAGGWGSNGLARFFIGHFSQSAASGEFIGLRFENHRSFVTGDAVKVIARVQAPNGLGLDTPPMILTLEGTHTFSYTYDPSIGAFGRLTVNVDALPTMIVNLDSGRRNSGAQFNGFGMGATSSMSNENDSTKTIRVFMDDLAYTGLQTSGLPTVSVTASDPNAAEQALNAGEFTFTRNGTSGDLTVNYTTSGTANSGSDYAALAGSVTILNGQSTATVTLTPIDDGSVEGSETVVLTISASANYTPVIPLSATVTIADNDSGEVLTFGSNPGWSGSSRTTGGNNYGWSPVTSQAGGTAGEAGGTFARSQNDSYYGDTFLSQSFNLTNTISGSGKFDVLGITSGWADVAGDSGLFIGHFSTSASNKEFIGLELKEDPSGLTSQMQVRARLQLPGGTGTAFSSWVNVSTNGNHTFSYTYNPSLGANGRLTVNIDALSPLTVDLSSGDRTSGSIFNAFGLGYTSNLNSENAPAKTAQVFIDDVQYSGFQPSVTIVATDASAAEQAANTGTFTITRTNTSGDLTVSYLVSGKATSGSDYSALAGSVTILNGQTSATVVVTPINDSLAEGDETVLLSLTGGSGYHLGSPNKAAVTIADNDTYALDNFENGNGSGGMGWNGAWTFGGTATVTSSGTPNTGSYHLQLTGSGASAARAVNLAGAASARLVFDWKANSFEAGETAVVEVFDGTNWITMLTVSDGQDDNVYHHADINIPAAALNSSFQVRIRSLMSSSDDLFYIDDIQIAL